ncbi:MAG: TRAP transporter large permease subunit [Chloroflexota bacterium]
MEWWVSLSIIFGLLVFFMATGLPVAFCFLIVVLIGIPLWVGSVAAYGQLILTLRESISRFTLIPIPLFILMGDIMFRSGVAPHMIRSIDKWLGRMPGRLSLLAIAGGTIFATMSGSSIAAVALLGNVLLPEMTKQGYKKNMSLGSIMASGCLAPLIPPSGLAVVVAVVAEVSVGAVLIAIIVPGFFLASLYATYVIILSRLRPEMAPSYEVRDIPLSEKLLDTARYILPMVFILFMVTGVILLGIASVTEAAASGALGVVILAAAHRKLKWDMLKKSLINTVELSVMILIIIAAASAFSGVLAYSGAGKGLIATATGLPLAPIAIIVAMLVVVIILGMFINPASIILICIPIFIPLVNALGFNPIWFCMIFLMCTEIGAVTPPFGVVLFAMKGTTPPDVTFNDCVQAVIPFLIIDLIALGILTAFPIISLWLPGLMR